MQKLQQEVLNISSYAWIILILYWYYSGKDIKEAVQKQPITERIIYLILMVASFSFIYYNVLPFPFLFTQLYKVTNLTIILGVVVQTLGILFSIMARKELGRNWSGTVTMKQGHELITSGPYRISRHPIYTGILVGLTGAAIILGQTAGFFAIAFYWIAASIKIATEEKYMRSLFSSYDNYMKKTSKIIPFIY